jgi:dihydrofolate reductase/thymidylate synthase
MKTPFSIVVAVDENFGIGRNNVLPWNLPGDMKHFKDVTTKDSGQRQNFVIMGRKTWESIPGKFRPLPERINCVLTRQTELSFPEGVVKAADFEQALAAAVQPPLKEKVGQIFVIGGGELFETAIKHPFCQSLYVTHIQALFQCDRFFPAIPLSFTETSRSAVFQEGSVRYFFSIYTKFQP